MIIIDQCLHGYANGHQMLYSSMDFTIEERKKIDGLSDLNGRCEEEDFQAYYTGYLLEANKYVIAKTWYANEMYRPGCVWTHSLILDIEDIQKVGNWEQVLKYFTRPDTENQYDYAQKIYYEENDGVCTKEYLKLNEELVEYFIYTIFGRQGAKIVYFETQQNYCMELFYNIGRMPVELLRTFTFSTMSYDIRSYNTIPFMYQITSKECAIEWDRRYADLNLCVAKENIQKYPFWVEWYKNILFQATDVGIRKFICQYGNDYFSWEYYNCFVRIYAMLQVTEHLSLDKYFNSISQVMEEQTGVVEQKTVELVLDEQFFGYEFVDIYFQILELIDMKRFKLTKNKKDKLIKKILEGNLGKLYPVLCRYKTGQLPLKEKKLVEDIIIAMKPNQLERIKGLDEDLYVVLVTINPMLLLAEHIWKMNREHQIMLIYAGGDWENTKELEKLLKVMVLNSNENISEICFSVYGEKMISILLNIFQKLQDDLEKDYLQWISILLKDPVSTLKSLTNFQSVNLSTTIFLQINKAGGQIASQIDSDSWIDIYHFIVNESNKKKIHMEYMVILFSSEQKFDIKFVEEIVKDIYMELLENRMSIEDWNKFQYVLPQVEACYAWDRCRRVRNALEQRGYHIQDINCNH